MAKTQEELNVIKEEVEALNKKLAELTEEELKQVIGGETEAKLSNEDETVFYCPFCGREVDWLDHDAPKRRDYFFCVQDGYLTFFWDDARWEKGWIR